MNKLFKVYQVHVVEGDDGWDKLEFDIDSEHSDLASAERRADELYSRGCRSTRIQKPGEKVPSE